MNLEIISEKDNRLLKRKEYLLSNTYDDATPSRVQMQELVAKVLKADKTHIEIYKILSDTGKTSGKVWARVWDEKTFSYGKPEEEKAEEAPKEAPAEEKKEGE